MKVKLPEKLVKPLDYLFIFRPTLFFPVWIITLARYSAYFTFREQALWWVLDFNIKLVFNFIFVTAVAGATFIYNQLMDISTDKVNKKLFLISEEYVRPKVAKRIANLSLVLSGVYFLATFQFITFVFIAFFTLLWGYLYNFKPFCWKDKAVQGLLVNIGGGFLLFVAGWSMAGGIGLDTALFSLPYMFAFGAVTLLTTIPDYEGDLASGKSTFAVRFGFNITIYLSVIFVFLALILGMYFKDPVISLPSLISIPLYVILLFKRNIPWVFRCIRYPILFLGLILCVQFPYFFILLVINYYLSRIYYLSRFGLDYPTFKVE